MTVREFARGRPELFVVAVLAIVTRLWALDWPHAVVFDETYYQQNAGHYLAGTFYFNLHPPLGSLLLGSWAWITGLSAESLLRPEPAPMLRMLPALAGALIIPVFHLLLLQLCVRRGVALLGAALLFSDTALLALSRLVLLDSLLLLFILLSLTTFLASLRREGGLPWGLMGASAICAGFAVSTKWTGLSAIGVVILVVIWRMITRVSSGRDAAMRLAIILAIPAVIYVGAFAVHFALLPRWGLGASMMSPAFQETLEQSPTYRAGASLSFTAQLADAHRAMVKANADIESRTHPGASPWWSWPILKHPMYVWEGEPTANGNRGHILIVGNPVVWWGTLVVLVALGIAAGVSRVARAQFAHRGPALMLLLACYLVNFAPFAMIQRHLFLYSYLPAFTFSLALAVLGVASLVGGMESGEPDSALLPRRPARLAAVGLAAIAVAAHLYLAALAYGTPISDAGFANRLRLIERSR